MRMDGKEREYDIKEKKSELQNAKLWSVSDFRKRDGFIFGIGCRSCPQNSWLTMKLTG